MAQESYADFSIIQKYIDQKRYYDEALKSHEAKVTKLEHMIRELQEELQAKDRALQQLQEQTNIYEATIKERERSMQELTLTIHRLKKQIEGGTVAGGAANGDELKAKFGFLKK